MEGVKNLGNLCRNNVKRYESSLKSKDRIKIEKMCKENSAKGNTCYKHVISEHLSSDEIFALIDYLRNEELGVTLSPRFHNIPAMLVITW